MKIVVGLGNPGKAYERTPHNIGFEVVDKLAARCDCKCRRSLRFKARVARTRIENEDVLLVKPLTFMNLSGEAVAPLARYYKVPTGDIVVVVDDADLPPRRLRIRPNGGSGGHRGLQSIIDRLGDNGFARVRIGIGRGGEDQALKKQVLSRLSAAEHEGMQPVVEMAADAVTCVIAQGVAKAMNEFNGQVQDEA